jgi:uncharacterized protein YndB with AHSA1/START domain
MTIQIMDVAADCRIISSRVVNAPVEKVFQAWTDPNHLAKWWDLQALQTPSINST